MLRVLNIGATDHEMERARINKCGWFFFASFLSWATVGAGFTVQEVYQKIKNSVYTLYSIDPTQLA